jgi:uncharacterized protein
MTDDPTTEQSLINSDLLQLLVCPVDRAPLEVVGNRLQCQQCERQFEVTNGIPNMLVDD